MLTESEVLRTLNLSEADRLKLLNSLDELDRLDAGRERRAELRYDYRPASRIMVRVEQAGSSARTHAVASRNISSKGLSFLHGGFLHIGTCCTVSLLTLDKQSVQATGRVSRCRCVVGRIHEFGLKFDVPIELSKFVRVEPVAAAISPSPPESTKKTG